MIAWVSLAAAAPLDPDAFPSLGSLSATTVEVDTDGLELRAGPAVHNGVLDGNVAVFTFDDVDVSRVDVVGSHPFALLSRGDLVVSDRVVADANDQDPGAGGGAGGAFGQPGEGPGAGGVACGGGFGGAGGGLCGGAPYGDLFVALEAGSGGGGEPNGYSPEGGGGGGGVELVALGRLEVGSVRASGGGGRGGGSGGGILLVGDPVSCRNELRAEGGDGDPGQGGGGGRVLVLGGDGCETELQGGSGAADGVDEQVVDPDVDGDGVFRSADCDDWDASVSPDQPEALCNGIDDDCDPATVDGPDLDEDGVSLCAGDCDDADAQRFPGAAEVPCDGVDQDCDAGTDDAPDVDGDGVSACDDCDDTDPDLGECRAHTGGTEPAPHTGEPPPDTGTPDDPDPTDDTAADAPLDVAKGLPSYCGCASTSATGPWSLAALLALAAYRRGSTGSLSSARTPNTQA